MLGLLSALFATPVLIAASSIALLAPTNQYKGNGQAALCLMQERDKVILHLTGSNFLPHERHAIHIHAFGDVSDQNEGLKQGGHFNPLKKQHGCSEAGMVTGFHIGDLGNKWESTELSLVNTSSPGYVLGRGVVIHLGTDDCQTQPTGNSGKRIFQGVIATSVDFAGGAAPDSVSAGGSAIATFTPSRLSPVSGTVLVKDTKLISVNITGAYPLRKIPVGIARLGDIKSIKLSYSCNYDALDASYFILATFVADDNGRVLNRDLDVTDRLNGFEGGLFGLLGRGLVLLNDPEICPKGLPIAGAPIGLAFKSSDSSPQKTSMKLDLTLIFALFSAALAAPAPKGGCASGQVYISNNNDKGAGCYTLTSGCTEYCKSPSVCVDYHGKTTCIYDIALLF
ncbi:superoxide dismutase [Obelidium mucronatum]|nr:superoxide dismutase [Obelidium mucronatum]